MIKTKKNSSKEYNKNKGPSCACGKEDLYEEWKRNQELEISSDMNQINKIDKTK